MADVTPNGANNLLDFGVKQVKGQGS